MCPVVRVFRRNAFSGSVSSFSIYSLVDVAHGVLPLHIYLTVPVLGSRKRLIKLLPSVY